MDQNVTSMAAQERPLTFGEKAVGLTFNPSGSMVVNTIKKLYADVITELDEARQLATSSETKRQYSIAITEAQTSQMWAVKAATWKD